MWMGFALQEMGREVRKMKTDRQIRRLSHFDDDHGDNYGDDDGNDQETPPRLLQDHFV